MKIKHVIISFLVIANSIKAADISNDCNKNYNVTNQHVITTIIELNQDTSQIASHLNSKNKIINFGVLQEKFAIRTGTKSSKLITNFQLYLNKIATLPEEIKIKKLNDYINSQFLYSEDKEIWGKPEYWASPLELFEKLAGDCEDFAILKYVALLELGVNPDKVRLSYVKIHKKNSTLKDESHMVLKYFQNPESEPMILDSIVNDIYPRSKRIDLIDYYDFNSKNVFVDNVKTKYQFASFLNWKECLEKMKSEGINL
jgi:predicted transglutaminase-like cysteine proteinase